MLSQTAGSVLKAQVLAGQLSKAWRVLLELEDELGSMGFVTGSTGAQQSGQALCTGESVG